MRIRSTLLCSAFGVTQGLLLASVATAQTSASPVAAVSETNSDEIVVTARRRDERLQSVPVSVTAFTAQSLEEKQVSELRDLTQSTPGLVFTQSGSGPNINITLRGQTKSAVGAGLPSVITYLNEVPLPTYGSSLPTFDLASVQVLKGPQGTYFGRNTTGGAVLVYTEQPSYDFGGYVSALYGSYNWIETEGALNVPIVADKAALRVAFNSVDRDGYTKNLSIPGKDWDDRNDWAVRASLLVEPFAGFRNVTVVDYLKSNTVGLSSIVITALAAGGARNAALAQFYNCSAATTVTANCNPAAPTPQNDVDLALARQQQIGVRAGYTDMLPLSIFTVSGITNTTTIDLASIKIKNIFGFRAVVFDSESNTDGIELPLIGSHFRQDDRQYTDELQVSGALLEDKLSWLIGGFYLKGKPGGVSGRALEQFRTPSGVIGNTPYAHSYYRDTSKALFGQLIYDFSSVIDGLKVNGGYRHTWDTQALCAASNLFSQARITEDQCKASGTSLQNQVKFKASTWTAGVDYQATRDIFLYATTRRGYRGGGINSPRLGGTLTSFQFFAPEKINDIEIGTKIDWRAGDLSGRFNIAAYRGKYKNIQGSIGGIPANFDGDNNPATDPASSSLVANRGAATIKGFEIDGFIRPLSGLTLSYGAAYTDAKFTNFALPAIFSTLSAGVPTFNATPELTLNGGLRYAASLGGELGELVFNADIYHSGKLLYGSVAEDGYEVVNARIDWNDALGTDVTASVFAKNLLNEKYIGGANLSSSGTTILTGPYGAPRMVGVQLRYKFGG